MVSVEQKLIVKNDRQCIYLIKETNLDFYLIIPRAQQVKIVLGIFNQVNDELIKSIPIQEDKAVVIPVIGEQILGQVNDISSRSSQYLDQVLAYLINTSYKILTYNHIGVETQVLLNYNSKFDNFHKHFLMSHQGRVASIELFPKSDVSNKITPIQEKIAPIENNSHTLEANIEKVIPTEVELEPNKEPLTETREPGFVSYVLLGVLVAVISLVFLYFII